MGRSIVLSILTAFTLIFGVERASAQTHPVVVELFTSQGCHSCPPADELLGRLADREDVIALSLHVDYWDYLGWRDVFGAKAHTARQRDYAYAQDERTIYTPQIVVHGREGMVGSREYDVAQAIERWSDHVPAATVSLVLMEDRLVADIAPNGDTPRRARVRMAWYSRAENVDIRAGENNGRTITYHNVVKG
ncbi:MAG: DUF1223 domain-containing protein, partial [Pseudomonadota bacterium]